MNILLILIILSILAFFAYKLFHYKEPFNPNISYTDDHYIYSTQNTHGTNEKMYKSNNKNNMQLIHTYYYVMNEGGSCCGVSPSWLSVVLHYTNALS